jgi:hexokinase
MGKGFKGCDGIIGDDLGDIIEQSCASRKLNVRMQAIINDGSATLLSRAYLDSSTRLALILGTGVNAAIHLPVSAVGKEKFGQRPSAWFDEASHVVINVELSMFGKNILPTTRWDDYLNTHHLIPDFQPFEYLVSGRYLGEIFRLILVEAVQTAGLFKSQMPSGMDEPYNFDTSIMAAIEGDATPDLSQAQKAIKSAFVFHTLPTFADLSAIQLIAKVVSRRAAAYLAVGIHALWAMLLKSEGRQSTNASGGNDNEGDSRGEKVSIGYNGSVIEKYPNFANMTQNYIDNLTGGERCVVLEGTLESALFGAAAAVGMAAK